MIQGVDRRLDALVAAQGQERRPNQGRALLQALELLPTNLNADFGRFVLQDPYVHLRLITAHSNRKA